MRQKGFAHFLVIIIIIVLVALVFVFIPKKKTSNNYFTQIGNNNHGSSAVPNGLSLPFSLNDINQQMGEVNPFGVVRFSLDREEFGHPGIDFPLFEGSNILAVADGEIVLIESAGDDWNGMKMGQLLKKTGKGEGWMFLYEHVSPVVGVGDRVKKGDVIATKAAPNRFTAHFQVSNAFEDYKYTRDNKCWPELLKEADKDALNAWWGDYSFSDTLVGAWKGNVEEGKYPFRGLFDLGNPKLCYPEGTDVR